MASSTSAPTMATYTPSGSMTPLFYGFIQPAARLSRHRRWYWGVTSPPTHDARKGIRSYKTRESLMYHGHLIDKSLLLVLMTALFGSEMAKRDNFYTLSQI